MKKIFKALTIAILGAMTLGVASCSNNSSNNESSSSSSTTTTSPSSSSSSSISTPSSSSSSSSLTSSSTHVDYINQEGAKLKLDYTDRSFMTDGVAQVSLAFAIDGDTAHFYELTDTSKTNLIKTRFYGVDTPESTGSVEPWGHAASDFTEDKLNEANKNGTIVITAAQETYGVPSFDSTGSRYLALVWVNLTEKNAPFETLTLLNLWLVQEGYSYTKNVNNMPSYEDLFFAAEAQARKEKLHLFSDEEDPDYPKGDYEMTTLIEIKREIEKNLADSTYQNKYNNKRVIVRGTVAGFSDHILYIQSYYNSDNFHSDTITLPEEGEYAGINVFVGMSSINSRYTTIGAFVEIRGLCQDSKFGFQITDTYFPSRTTSTDPKASKVILKAEETAATEYALYTHEFDKAADLISASTDVLYCRVSIKEALKVTRAYVSSESEITLYFNAPFDVYITFMYYENDSALKPWSSDTDFVGKSFYVSGVYSYHDTTSGNRRWQIIPTSNSDLPVVAADSAN
ncbi:putative DNase/RNase endonuclease [Firmicutes bacterium CAG:345]|nr:putative DNase/RNase endonuclease [Firmicutes bacterium CAG:345]